MWGMQFPACGVAECIGVAGIHDYEYCVYARVCVCNAGNELGEEGSAAIGDGIKSCPELTELNLSSNLRKSRGGRVRDAQGHVQGHVQLCVCGVVLLQSGERYSEGVCCIFGHAPMHPNTQATKHRQTQSATCLIK